MTAYDLIEKALDDATKSLMNTVHLNVALSLIQGNRPIQAAYNLGSWVASVGYPQTSLRYIAEAIELLHEESRNKS